MFIYKKIGMLAFYELNRSRFSTAATLKPFNNRNLCRWSFFTCCCKWLMRPNQRASFSSFSAFHWSRRLFVFAKGHSSMLSSLHPHRRYDQSNAYKCLLCEIGGLDSKAFKEILYMILHNREQRSLRHHPACFSKVISTKIKLNIS